MDNSLCQSLACLGPGCFCWKGDPVQVGREVEQLRTLLSPGFPEGSLALPLPWAPGLLCGSGADSGLSWSHQSLGCRKPGVQGVAGVFISPFLLFMLGWAAGTCLRGSREAGFPLTLTLSFPGYPITCGMVMGVAWMVGFKVGNLQDRVWSSLVQLLSLIFSTRCLVFVTPHLPVYRTYSRNKL